MLQDRSSIAPNLCVFFFSRPSSYLHAPLGHDRSITHPQTVQRVGLERKKTHTNRCDGGPPGVPGGRRRRPAALIAAAILRNHRRSEKRYTCASFVALVSRRGYAETGPGYGAPGGGGDPRVPWRPSVSGSRRQEVHFLHPSLRASRGRSHHQVYEVPDHPRNIHETPVSCGSTIGAEQCMTVGQTVRHVGGSVSGSVQFSVAGVRFQ